MTEGVVMNRWSQRFAVGLAIAVLCPWTDASAIRLDIPTLIELDRLDPEGARISRYALTTRGAVGQRVPIPDSSDYFCTLSHAHNVVLTYSPVDGGIWEFEIQANESAQLAAGGLATCLRLDASESG